MGRGIPGSGGASLCLSFICFAHSTVPWLYTWSLHSLEMTKMLLLHDFVQYIDNGKCKLQVQLHESVFTEVSRCLMSASVVHMGSYQYSLA